MNGRWNGGAGVLAKGQILLRATKEDVVRSHDCPGPRGTRHIELVTWQSDRVRLCQNA